MKEYLNEYQIYKKINTINIFKLKTYISCIKIFKSKYILFKRHKMCFNFTNMMVKIYIKENNNYKVGVLLSLYFLIKISL